MPSLMLTAWKPRVVVTVPQSHSWSVVEQESEAAKGDSVTCSDMCVNVCVLGFYLHLSREMLPCLL